mgnify:CR=1 FL=1
MTRRGAILLEMLLAVALFAMAGLAIYGALDRAADGTLSTRTRLQGADLAWSAIALIESGVARPESLDGPITERSPLWTGPDPGAGVDTSTESPWSIRVTTEPGMFRGTTVVSVTAVRREGGAERDWYTARQLVRVGGGAVAASDGSGAP